MPHPSRRTGTRRGFTLAEVLIAIAIVLLIGGIALVNFLPKRDQAKVDLQQIQIDRIDDALRSFYMDLDRYPTEDEGLSVLWSRDVLEDEDEQERWRGPYLGDPVREDQWGAELVYREESELREGTYDIVSLGPDGEEGTEDDITNHSRFTDEDGELGEDFDVTPPDVSAG